MFADMKITLTSAALFVVLLTVLTNWAYNFINWLWLNPKSLEKFLRQQGLTGSSYTILFGDTKDERRMYYEANSKPITLSNDIIPRLIPFAAQHIKKYGTNSFAWMGVTPNFFVLEPELIKEVFTRIDEFRKPLSEPIFKRLVDGLISYEDEKWVKHRKLLNPAFSIQKLKNMVPAFNGCTNEMIKKWETFVSEDGSFVLDVWPDLQNLSRDIISRTAFGSSFEEGKRLFKLQKDMFSIFLEFAVLENIPGYRWLPTKPNCRIKEMNKDINNIIQDMIVKKKKAMMAGITTRDDLLQILIESSLNEKKEHKHYKNVSMSIEEVIEECKLFYLAGQETTSVLLVWTMILLSHHREWQERARQEVLEVFGNNMPHMEGLSLLKTLNMILHEVLRLYPPVLIFERETQKETKISNFTLPPGVRVSVPVLLLHHDRKIWGEDADMFKPERFAEGVFKASKGKVAFMPFGWGPRICIGMNFSLLEAKVVFALILQHFSFELSPSYTHAPCRILTTQPQHGAHLILHKHSL